MKSSKTISAALRWPYKLVRDLLSDSELWMSILGWLDPSGSLCDSQDDLKKIGQIQKNDDKKIYLKTHSDTSHRLLPINGREYSTY